MTQTSEWAKGMLFQKTIFQGVIYYTNQMSHIYFSEYESLESEAVFGVGK